MKLSPIDSSSASPEVRAKLDDVQKRYGFVPNLYRVFANAPIALDAYDAVAAIFQKGTLSTTERNIVLLATARENGCTYCVAVHSTVADMQKDPPRLTDAIRAGTPIDDRRLEALRRLTTALVRGRGHADAEIEAFVAAGYRPEQVIEVIVGIMLKTLSNYVNHVAHTPLDAAFAGREWRP